MNNNHFEYYNFKVNKYLYKEKIIKEYGEILNIQVLSNNKIFYLSENEEKYKILVFLNSKKQANCAILSKDNLVGNHNMIIVENYIYIFFEEYVYIYNYMEEQPIRKTKFKFFSKISNIINISSDKILILFYNKQKKEIFTIREYHVYLGEYKTAKFDCIGEGFIQLKMVKQIINIDDHKILIKEIKGPLLIIVKISEISQLFKRNYNKYNSDNVDMNNEFILDESQDEINKNEINNINIRSNLDNKQKEEINLDINNNIINIKENSIKM